jgi:hypothetical protein
VFSKVFTWGAGAVGAIGGLAAVASTKPVFAAAVVTAEDLAAIQSDLLANVEAILPVGLAVLGVMLGITLIPRVIYKFF